MLSNVHTRACRFFCVDCQRVLVVDSFSDEDGFSDEDDSQPCVLRIDERTTETRLRTAIFLADLEKAANILSTSNEAFSLGAGLTYTPEQACLFVRSDDITRDPDIVAIKVTRTFTVGFLKCQRAPSRHLH